VRRWGPIQESTWTPSPTKVIHLTVIGASRVFIFFRYPVAHRTGPARELALAVRDLSRLRRRLRGDARRHIGRLSARLSRSVVHRSCFPGELNFLAKKNSESLPPALRYLPVRGRIKGKNRTRVRADLVTPVKSARIAQCTVSSTAAASVLCRVALSFVVTERGVRNRTRIRRNRKSAVLYASYECDREMLSDKECPVACEDQC